jgi:hypothetical protein
MFGAINIDNNPVAIPNPSKNRIENLENFLVVLKYLIFNNLNIVGAYKKKERASNSSHEKNFTNPNRIIKIPIKNPL